MPSAEIFSGICFRMKTSIADQEADIWTILKDALKNCSSRGNSSSSRTLSGEISSETVKIMSALYHIIMQRCVEVEQRIETLKRSCEFEHAIQNTTAGEENNSVCPVLSSEPTTVSDKDDTEWVTPGTSQIDSDIRDVERDYRGEKVGFHMYDVGDTRGIRSEMKYLLREMKRGLPTPVRSSHSKQLASNGLGGHLTRTKIHRNRTEEAVTSLSMIADAKWDPELDSMTQHRRCHECNSFRLCYCSGDSEHCDCQNVSNSMTTCSSGRCSLYSFEETVEEPKVENGSDNETSATTSWETPMNNQVGME